MEDQEIQDQLSSIRNLMERSSKFISLSGLSGVMAGIYALIGAGLAYNIVYNGSARDIDIHRHMAVEREFLPTIYLLATIAGAVLIASLVTGYILTYNKAKRKGQAIWGQASRALLFHMAIPLVTGGALIFILLLRGYYGIVASSSLIFYGLALIGASNFTFKDVQYLGILEIILGLIAACLPGYGLYFWAIGFGLLHIVYGSIMYLKYDR